MGDFVVRVARPADADAVGALLQASYPELLAAAYERQLLDSALALLTRANPVLLASGTYYVAESSAGVAVGCGGWTRERPGTTVVEPQLAHLRHFGTHPAWIRRGVGRAIYSRCEAAARDAGIHTFECYSSLNAENFYRALGFTRLRAIDMELKPQVVMNGVLMRCEIS